MFFRNLTILAFPATWGSLLPTEIAPDLAAGLSERLGECRLRAVGPLEMSTRGFVSPFGRDAEELVHQIGDAAWLTIGGEDKILPPAVINDLLARRIAELEEREGRRIGGRTRRQLKDDLVAELLPKAFVQPVRLDAYIDFARRLLLVDTSSRRNAENCASEIRRAVGQFPALPLNAQVAPRNVLTGWLAGEPLPEGLSLGDECELRDPVDGGAVVKIQHAELRSDEVDKHLEAGLQCARLALVLEDRVSFVFGDDLVIRKLRFLDGAVEAMDAAEPDDMRAELDARFALMSGEVGRLYDVLAAACRFSSPDQDAPAPAAPRARRGSLEGVDSITISAPGQEGFSFTLTPRQFEQLGVAAEQFADAARWVRSTGKVSIAGVQRQMKVGYNQAARIVEALETAGVVSAPDSRGARAVTSTGAR